MTAAIREWLPIEVTGRAKVREAIDAVVLDWSKDWFATQRLQATRFRSLAEGLRVRPEGESWRGYRGPVALSVTTQAAMRLVSWALDAPLANLELNHRDAGVVEALEHSLLDDLAARIEALLNLPDQPARSRPVERLLGSGDGLEVAVTDESGALVATIALPLEVILPLVRASLPKARPSDAAIGSFATALASTKVRIEVTIGRADVGVADLRRLAKGDVLVLDRALDAGVGLELPNTGEAIMAARLGESDGRLTLTLDPEQI